jgi:hypothetical protein
MSGDSFASPFSFFLTSFETAPHPAQRRSLEIRETPTGKAQPFRTSGGTAAKKTNFQRCLNTVDSIERQFIQNL